MKKIILFLVLITQSAFGYDLCHLEVEDFFNDNKPNLIIKSIDYDGQIMPGESRDIHTSGIKNTSDSLRGVYNIKAFYMVSSYYALLVDQNCNVTALTKVGQD